MKALIALLLLPSLSALAAVDHPTATAPVAAEPTLDEIVSRARAVADKKADRMTCRMTMETAILDTAGNLEHREFREGDVTIHGDDAVLEPTRIVRDGKPMSDADIQKERAKMKEQRDKHKGQNDDFELSPLGSKNASGERFELLRKEQLWGHDAYVVKVTATRAAPSLANGTLWIDAVSYVELKGEVTPAKLPDHADWVKVQEQFALSDGISLPTYLHIVGAGHRLVFHKGFESTLKWSGCKK
jgi:hypothetical protein